MTETTHLHCACQQVQIQVEKAPIISTECHCNSCRAAGERLEALPGVPRVREANAGTRFVLYRKDRVHFKAGIERLLEFRLTPKAKTRRVVAGCCNTPVFLEFESGHWLSLYASLWPTETLPPLQERTMTGDLASASTLPDDVPNSKSQSFAFFRKLLGAWIAMGLRSPKVAASGPLDA